MPLPGGPRELSLFQEVQSSQVQVDIWMGLTTLQLLQVWDRTEWRERGPNFFQNAWNILSHKPDLTGQITPTTVRPGVSALS